MKTLIHTSIRFALIALLFTAPMTLTGCSADDLVGPDTELPEGDSPAHGRGAPRNF